MVNINNHKKGRNRLHFKRLSLLFDAEVKRKAMLE